LPEDGVCRADAELSERLLLNRSPARGWWASGLGFLGTAAQSVKVATIAHLLGKSSAHCFNTLDARAHALANGTAGAKERT
jgi:hypothetical protein